MSVTHEPTDKPVALNQRSSLNPLNPLCAVYGILFFLIRPLWWLRPVVTCLLAWALSIMISAGVLWWQWPSALLEGFWSQAYAVSWSMAYATATFVGLWIIAIPFIMGIACEKLALKVIRQQGNEYCIVQSESVLQGALSSGTIFIRSLPWRIWWLSTGLCCMLLFPPLGICVSAVALGHICVLDASEIVLVVLGCTGAERQRFYKQHRVELLVAGCVAGGCSALLGSTLIGLLLWLPGIVCGAALSLPRMVAASRT